MFVVFFCTLMFHLDPLPNNWPGINSEFHMTTMPCIDSGYGYDYDVIL